MYDTKKTITCAGYIICWLKDNRDILELNRELVCSSSDITLILTESIGIGGLCDNGVYISNWNWGNLDF